MKINCLGCGLKIDLDEAYDDYEGEIRCLVCARDLWIKTHEGMVHSVALVPTHPATRSPAAHKVPAHKVSTQKVSKRKERPINHDIAG